MLTSQKRIATTDPSSGYANVLTTFKDLPEAHVRRHLPHTVAADKVMAQVIAAANYSGLVSFNFQLTGHADYPISIFDVNARISGSFRSQPPQVLHDTLALYGWLVSGAKVEETPIPTSTSLADQETWTAFNATIATLCDNSPQVHDRCATMLGLPPCEQRTHTKKLLALRLFENLNSTQRRKLLGSNGLDTGPRQPRKDAEELRKEQIIAQRQPLSEQQQEEGRTLSYQHAFVLGVTAAAALSSLLSATIGSGGSIMFNVCCAVIPIFFTAPKLEDVRLVALVANYRTAVGNIGCLFAARPATLHGLAQVGGLMLVGAIPGTICGLVLYRGASLSALTLLIAISCLVVAVQHGRKLSRNVKPSLTTPVVENEEAEVDIIHNRSAAVVTGFGMGFFGGSIGIQTIPILVYFLYYPMHPTDMRTLGMAVAIPIAIHACYGMHKDVGVDEKIPWVPVLLATHAGTAVGLKLHSYVHSDFLAASAMVTMLSVVGCQLLHRTLMQHLEPR
jgi:uncharacterized membrane protein YfcA